MIPPLPIRRLSWLVAELNGRRVVGMPGVRDLNEEDNCEDFAPGSPSAQGECDSDGHYMCEECQRCNSEQWRMLKEMP